MWKWVSAGLLLLWLVTVAAAAYHALDTAVTFSYSRQSISEYKRTVSQYATLTSKLMERYEKQEAWKLMESLFPDERLFDKEIDRLFVSGSLSLSYDESGRIKEVRPSTSSLLRALPKGARQ